LHSSTFLAGIGFGASTYGSGVTRVDLPYDGSVNSSTSGGRLTLLPASAD
jgi:hypothetical protein